MSDDGHWTVGAPVLRKAGVTDIDDGLDVLSDLPPTEHMSVDSNDAQRRSRPAAGRAAQRHPPTIPGDLEFCNKRSEKPRPKKCYIWAKAIVEHKVFTAVTTLFTVFALLGDDFRLIYTNQPADFVFNILVVVCIVTFSADIILGCLGKDDYFMGFFFGLDAISTVTLFLDLTPIQDLFFKGNTEGGLEEARSGRTARMGARIGRIVRVLRLVRIVKLYKVFVFRQEEKKKGIEGRPVGFDDDDNWSDDSEEEEAKPGKESLVGKKLSEKTTERTIIIVLLMLFFLPFLNQNMPISHSAAYYGADDVYKAFREYESNQTASYWSHYEETMLKYIYYHNWHAAQESKCPVEGYDCPKLYESHVFWIGMHGTSLEKLEPLALMGQLREETVLKWNHDVSKQANVYNYGTIPPTVLPVLWSRWKPSQFGMYTGVGISLLNKETETNSFVVKVPSDLRTAESFKYSPAFMTSDEFKTMHFAFYFDVRPIVVYEARMNIVMTVFICVVLCVTSLLFSKDANVLVLAPVEQMIGKVEDIRDNPLIAIKMSDDEFKRDDKKHQIEQEEKRTARSCITKLCSGNSRNEVLETAILERTIITLGSLLALGFGEAGADIVSHTMKGSSGVNAISSGSRVTCIIGNARINDFSIANVVLQTKVMTFVNQIAEIVHGVVDEYFGAVNKNNGDTFVVIWRTEGMDKDMVTRQSDYSIVGFSKILGAIHQSPVLADYRSHPGLQQRLGSNCRVHVSFGLHYGWAIEGAVGSEFKIDASYVSPNVSITEHVEKATRFYGVPLLASQTVVELCTPEVVEKMRLIDNVTIKGSKEPIELYVVDLDYTCLEIDAPFYIDGVWNPRMRFRSRQQLEHEKQRKLAKSGIALFHECASVETMSECYTEEFREVFNMGYQNYRMGEWQAARRYLSKTKAMLNFFDGPSQALLAYMEVLHSFQAPDGWVGVHPLEEFEAVHHRATVSEQMFYRFRTLSII